NIVQNPNPNPANPDQTNEYQPSANNSYGNDAQKPGADYSRYGPYSGGNRGRGGRNSRGRGGRSGGGRTN
ncbi:hypothetical protein A2U01_0113720, partial [Trifolium medium]|nr:hypothetical protein [Trifolium medium]